MITNVFGFLMILGITLFSSPQLTHEPGRMAADEQVIRGDSIDAALKISSQHATTPSILHVDSAASGPAYDGLSWKTAYANLQDALASAKSGNEIWVARGVYYPDVGASQDKGD